MAGLYVIAHRLDDGWDAPCKIGISSAWPKRLGSLQSGNPKPIGLYAFIELYDRQLALEAERYLHRRLSDRRLIGEWFQVEPPVAAAMARLFVTVMAHQSALAEGVDIDALSLVQSVSTGPGA